MPVTLTNPDTPGEIAQVTGVVAAELEHLRGLARDAEAKAAKVKNDTYERRKAFREADRRLDAEERAEAAAESAADIGARWRTSAELKAQPPTKKLLGRILPMNALVMLAGDPGTYKSFIALDWALCIRTGRNWSSSGRGTVHTSGPVVYLAGEGDAGIPKRIAAWEQIHYDRADAGLEVFPSAIGLRAGSPAAEAVIVGIVERSPVLVVIDTVARYSLGLDENSVKDMGEFIATADEIRQRTGACVLLVHHNARGTGRERGSTAIRGAMDGLVLVEKLTDRDDAGKGIYRVELSLDRMKDESSGGKPITVELGTVDLGTDPDDGLPITSLARTPDVDPFAAPLKVAKSRVPTAESSTVYEKLLWELYCYAPSDNEGLGYQRSELRAHAVASPLAGRTNLNKKWSDFWAAALEKKHLVRVDPERDTRAWVDTTLVETDFGWTRDDADAALHERGEQVR